MPYERIAAVLLWKMYNLQNYVGYFFVIKRTRCTNFTNLFCHETLHVSDSSSVHHQEFIHCTLSNVMCHSFKQSQNGTQFYPDEGQTNCPKHVEFHDKINL